MPSTRPILFTAFEPSGDAHAAPVIRELLRREPGRRVIALGGERMAEAGAILLENTADRAAMGFNALSKVQGVRAQIRRLRDRLPKLDPVVHVPVDSPAANFPVAKLARSRGMGVVHLVAPQLWAWGSWRLKKLRKATDLVLCLLPFEEAWFRQRGVPARFIGHPRLNRPLDLESLEERAKMLPRAPLRLATLPGSREHEIHANLGLLLKTYEILKDRHADLVGVVAAASPRLKELIHARAPMPPADLHVVQTDIDAVVRWCRVALCVSGTVTLDVARQTKPMVGVYRVGYPSMALAKVMLRTPYRLLPNVIAGREIVPEFVPYAGGFAGAGGAGPIVRAVDPFLADSAPGRRVSEDLATLLALYEGKDPATEAADAIEAVARGERV